MKMPATHIKKYLRLSLVKKFFSHNIDIFCPHCASRTFYEGGVCPNLDDKMAKIQSRITFLEELEKKLAKRYKMVGNLDSVEVHAEAKRVAFDKYDNREEVLGELARLDELNELRRQLAELKSSGKKFHTADDTVIIPAFLVSSQLVNFP
ncbi:hypothetical protein EDD85DRAFT_788782 [Armillaria nabsnona]|nr:hypothetical protein EDD85DRAFT_788782 [Armillaria nabsnona]